MAEILDSNGLTADHRALIAALRSWISNERICNTLSKPLGVQVAVALASNAPERVLGALAVQVLGNRITRQQIARERKLERGTPKADTMKALMSWKESLERELARAEDSQIVRV